MLPVIQLVALLATTTFAGAAIYISFVEHPARMSCSIELAATQWTPSYKRATLMQAPLAIVGFLFGSLAWWLGAGLPWLVGALFILMVVPFTLLVIGPLVNGPLLESHPEREPAETRALLDKWGRLHAVRSILALIASFIFAWSAIGP